MGWALWDGDWAWEWWEESSICYFFRLSDCESCRAIDLLLACGFSEARLAIECLLWGQSTRMYVLQRSLLLIGARRYLCIVRTYVDTYVALANTYLPTYRNQRPSSVFNRRLFTLVYLSYTVLFLSLFDSANLPHLSTYWAVCSYVHVPGLVDQKAQLLS